MDQVHAVDGHAVEAGELGEVILERGLQVLGRGAAHGLDEDVAQVAVAVANPDPALRLALALAQRLPALLADLLAPSLDSRHLDEPLRLARAVARVAHEHGVLAQPVQPDRRGLGRARRLPAAAAALLLVHLLPVVEQLPAVREELGDLIGDVLRGPTCGAAGSEVISTRRVRGEGRGAGQQVSGPNLQSARRRAARDRRSCPVHHGALSGCWCSAAPSRTWCSHPSRTR